MVFSVWNVGEVLGVLDHRRRQGFLTRGEFSASLLNFADEAIRNTRQGTLTLSPVTGLVLTDSWKILLEEHIYAADALQIASSKHAKCDLFLSADRTLLESAKAQGLTALDPEKDEEKISFV